MITFLFLAHIVDATLLALFLLVLTCLVIRFCLGGWGVGGMITLPFLAHMVDATLLALFLLVLTCLVIRLARLNQTAEKNQRPKTQEMRNDFKIPFIELVLSSQ